MRRQIEGDPLTRIAQPQLQRRRIGCGGNQRLVRDRESIQRFPCSRGADGRDKAQASLLQDEWECAGATTAQAQITAPQG